jgi:uncharacterized protein (UPF0332 family)
MTIKNQEDYINYRFHRAVESFEEAKILADNAKWNSVINRLYYACFYAVIALLLKNEIDVTTHDGTRTQFGLNFIKTGKIDKKFGKLFSRLFDYRQRGDYGDLFDFDEKIAAPLFSEVNEFIEEIRRLL